MIYTHFTICQYARVTNTKTILYLTLNSLKHGTVLTAEVSIQNVHLYLRISSIM